MPVGAAARRNDVHEWWYHPALEQLTDFVVVMDAADGTILYVNRFVEELLGFGAGEGIGAPIADYVHPDDILRAAEVMGLMAGDDLGVPLTPAVYRIRTADGSWKPVELNATLHANDDGERVVVIVGRYSGDRDLQDQIVERLIAGASPSEVIDLVPRSKSEFAMRHTAGKLDFATNDQGHVTGFTMHLGGVEYPIKRLP